MATHKHILLLIPVRDALLKSTIVSHTVDSKPEEIYSGIQSHRGSRQDLLEH